MEAHKELDFSVSPPYRVLNGFLAGQILRCQLKVGERPIKKEDGETKFD